MKNEYLENCNSEDGCNSDFHYINVALQLQDRTWFPVPDNPKLGFNNNNQNLISNVKTYVNAKHSHKSSVSQRQ